MIKLEKLEPFCKEGWIVFDVTGPDLGGPWGIDSLGYRSETGMFIFY